jgi:hypothetical protein
MGTPAAGECRGRSIIINIWPAPDKEIKKIVEAFYEKWLSAYSGSQAIRKSKLDTITEVRKAGKSSHLFSRDKFVMICSPLKINHTKIC